MNKLAAFFRQKKVIIAGSIVISALVLGVVGTIVGISLFNKAEEQQKEEEEDKNANLYALGVEQLVNREHKAAFDTFGKITDYKDSIKKQDYAYQLNRIDEHDYNFENIIDEIVRYSGKAVVNFNTNGGTEITPKTITEKQDKYITEIASKSYEDFAGWSLSYGQYNKDDDSVTLKLNASYTHHEYSIGYVLDGGDLPSDAPLHFTYYSNDIHLPAPTKIGHDFAGYIEKVGDTPEVDFVIPTHTHQDVTVKAIYEASTIHVNFDANGGTCSETEGDYKYLSQVVLPNASKEHYSFDGWYYNDELVNQDEFNVCENNATLVAHYSEIPDEYTITYHGVPDEIKNTLPKSFNYDSPDIRLPFPCKKYYAFIGWQEVAGGPFIVSYTIPTHTDHNIEIWAEYVEVSQDPYTNVVSGITDLHGTGLQDKVTEIVFSKEVTSINYDVFEECLNKVDHIYFEEGSRLQNIDNMIIRNNDEGTREFIHVVPKPFEGVESITLPSVNKIHQEAFKNSEIKHVIAPNVLEEVGTRGFEYSQVIDITGSDLKVIGDYAFKGCEHLNNSLFTDNPNIEQIGTFAFSGCTSLSDISVTGKAKTIKEKAFENCTGIETVRLENEKGATIVANAFEGCSGVKALYARMNNIEHALSLIPDAKDNLEKVYLSGTGSLPGGVFSEYSKLTTVEFAEGVTFTTIKEDTFSSTSSFEEINIPSSVNRIESNAFKDSHLTDVTFEDPSKLKYIESSAFENSGLTSLDLSKAKKLVIEDDAFKNCKDLTEISLYYDTLESIKSAFDGCSKLGKINIHFPETSSKRYSLPANFFSNISSVTEVNLVYEGSETKKFDLSIGLFFGCKSLINLELVNFEIGTLADYAFENCISFTNSEGYLSNLEVYPRGVFYGCNKLEISLEGTKEIDSYAFASCNCLGNLFISKSVQTIGSEAFAYVSGGSINVEYTLEELADKLAVDGSWYDWNKNCFSIINYGASI